MTQQLIKTHLHYDENTGFITVINPTSSHQKVGQHLHTKPYINLFGKSYGILSILALYIYGDYNKKLITLDGTQKFTKDNLIEVGQFTNAPLTQELLKKFLSYDSSTGIFTWIARPTSNIIVGTQAGNVQGSLPDAGYVNITLCGRQYRAHRLAWLYVHGVLPDNQIDHINHNREDNRIVNLRVVSNHTNMKNKSLYTTNTSGHSGVEPHGKNWKARIGVNGTKILLGVFITFEEAVAARKAAEKLLEYHKNHGLFKPNDYPTLH